MPDERLKWLSYTEHPPPFDEDSLDPGQTVGQIFRGAVGGDKGGPPAGGQGSGVLQADQSRPVERTALNGLGQGEARLHEQRQLPCRGGAVVDAEASGVGSQGDGRSEFPEPRTAFASYGASRWTILFRLGNFGDALNLLT